MHIYLIWDEEEIKISSGLNFLGRLFRDVSIHYTHQCSPAVAFLLNSTFRILTLSSHVVPRGIRRPFELVCHRHTDELVIIATRLNLLGKKACPSDTLPVLWRGQRRDGFAGLISELLLWCLWEKGWFKARVQSHGLEPPNLRSIPMIVGYSYFSLTLYQIREWMNWIFGSYWGICQLQGKSVSGFVLCFFFNGGKASEMNSLGTCLIDVGIYWPGGTPTLVANWSPFPHKTQHSPWKQA